MNINPGKAMLVFGIGMCVIVFVIGLIRFEAWMDLRGVAVTESFGNGEYRSTGSLAIGKPHKPDHPPIVWTTNGTAVTAEGWDEANKCYARWTRDSDPAHRCFSWSRLDGDTDAFWQGFNTAEPDTNGNRVDSKTRWVEASEIARRYQSKFSSAAKQIEMLQSAAALNAETIKIYKEVWKDLAEENAALKKRIEELGRDKSLVDHYWKIAPPLGQEFAFDPIERCWTSDKEILFPDSRNCARSSSGDAFSIIEMLPLKNALQVFNGTEWVDVKEPPKCLDQMPPLFRTKP